jgi:hypothetical protein
MTLSAATAWSAFRLSIDRSLLALVDWTVIGFALVAPLVLLRQVCAESSAGEGTRAGLRLILLTYVPLWTALRMLERLGSN